MFPNNVDEKAYIPGRKFKKLVKFIWIPLQSIAE